MEKKLRFNGEAKSLKNELISQGDRPTVRSARVYLLSGDLTAEDLAAIKKYVINPVEARVADLEEKTTLKME